VGFVGAALTLLLAADEDSEWDEDAPMVLLPVAFFGCVGVGTYLACFNDRCTECGKAFARSEGMGRGRCRACGARHD
jgi:hypothetical protein